MLPPPAGDDSALTAAIRRHEERLAREPEPPVFAALAELYRRAGRTGDAVACCREWLSRQPRDAEGRLALARALADDGQLEAATAQARAVVELDPRHADAQRFTAELARRQGDIETAVRHLEEAVALDVDDRTSRALLGLLRADPAGRAEATGLARVLRDETYVTLPFGMLCLEQGLADEAAQIFGRLLRKDPHHAEARAGLEQALRARLRRKG
jgi:tetratricopeptide (TPR) repeat protein